MKTAPLRVSPTTLEQDAMFDSIAFLEIDRVTLPIFTNLLQSLNSVRIVETLAYENRTLYIQSNN